MKKFFGVFISIFILLMSILIFIIFYNNIEQKSMQYEYPIEGYGLKLYKPNGEQNMDNKISKNEKNEFDYIVKFVNNTDYNNTFQLSVYLNYEQVLFNLGTQNNLTDYRFNLKSRQEKDIPVRFSLKDAFYKSNDIIISVMAGADKYTSDLNKTSNFYGISSGFTLNNPNYTKDFSQTVIAKNTKLFMPKEHFNGIIVNDDFDIKDKVRIPPLSLTAKPCEKLKFAVRAGGINTINNYLAWLTLNGKQIPFNQGKKYWYFSAMEGKLAYEEIFFNAPEIQGKYEVCAYLSMNPFSEHSFDNKKIYSSYRFTIIVE